MSRYTEQRYAGYIDDKSYWDKHITFNVLSHVVLDKLSNVLDFGCGVGAGTEILTRTGANVIGFDTNPEQVLEGAARLGGAATMCFAEDPSVWLSTRRDSFDLILLDNVIEHFSRETMDVTLLALKEALRESGSIVVVTPNAASLIGSFLRYDDHTHRILFTESSLRSVLVDAGFEVELQTYVPPGTGARRSLLRIEKWLVGKLLRVHGYNVRHSGDALVAVAKLPHEERKA